MIKEILSVERNGQSIFSSTTSAAARTTHATGTDRPSDFATATARAATHASDITTDRWATSATTFTAPFCRRRTVRATALRRSCAASFTAPTERAADAHTYTHRTRTVAVVARNDVVARARIIKTGAARRIRRAVSVQLREGRPLIVLAIEIQVLPCRNVEWRARVDHDERIERQFPPGRIVCAKQREPL